MRRAMAAAAVAVLVGATGCSDDPDGGVGGGVTQTLSGPIGDLAELTVGTVDLADGLDVPWGLAILTDGSALVAERGSGRVVRTTPVNAESGSAGPVTEVGVVPGVKASGEGGLLGLAVAPKDDDTVYAYFTSTSGDNRVVALPFDGTRFGTPKVLLSGIPSAQIHNGGRMVVGPDGDLYIGTGDGGERPNAQDTKSLGGKILRITTTGAVPQDNPFGNPVFSYGHRNVQGLAFDSAGRLWATEFGQNTYDELNLVQAGRNYGWPVVEGVSDDDAYVNPQVTWSPSEASPSGVAVVDDVAYVATLRGQRLWQVPLAGGRAGAPVAVFEGEYGRLRTVLSTPDGDLLLTTSNRDGKVDPRTGDDRILRVAVG